MDSQVIIFSIFFSIIGIAYFSYGKKGYPIFMVSGGLLMIYPYFIGTLFWLIVVGILLSAIPFLLKL